MLSDNKPYCHLSPENNEQQNIKRFPEELVLAWQKISRQGLLNKIIQAMRGTLVLDEILQTTVNQLQVALKVSHCLILRPDPDNQMVIRYVSETTDERDRLIGVSCPFYHYYHETLCSGESVVLYQFDETLPPELLSLVHRYSSRAVMIVPLVHQNSYIGGITLVQGENVAPMREDHFQEWTASDLEFVKAIADHCAIAINQAELHQQLQTQLAQHNQVEEALRQSEARYRAIVEDQTELICRFKPDGTLTFVNDAYCRYFGLQRSELIGQKFLPTMPSEDRKLITKNFRSLSQEHPINTYEHRVILPSGEIRWQQWSDRALFDELGNFIECQAVGRDITKLKQAEADIRMALEKERELSELRSSFISLVSHEFRTPLTTIQSSSELLERYTQKLSDEKKQTHYSRIQNAVKQMTQLLEDVLTIGQTEAGKLKFNPSPVDLVAFCHDIVESMHFSASPRHTINFVSSGHCTHSQMDEKLLGHIVTNLLSNAIKYSPEGGTVQFDLVCNPSSAVFRIQDSGIGIPPEDLDKLYDSFGRASNVGTIQGTGLGLAIVKNCVDLHGGKIDVESELGAGTKFTVTLPLNSRI